MTDTSDFEEYQKYLHTLPRAERRRILKAHLKRATQVKPEIQSVTKESQGATS